MCEACGGHENENEEAYETITLTLDDGTEVICEVIGTFDLDGVDYIALMPEEDEEVLIYRYSEEGDQISLKAIESDEEFEAVSEAFDELFFEDEDDEDEDEDDDDEEEDDE